MDISVFEANNKLLIGLDRYFQLLFHLPYSYNELRKRKHVMISVVWRAN